MTNKKTFVHKIHEMAWQAQFSLFILNKTFGHPVSVYQRMLKIISWFPQKYWAENLFLTLIMIRNVSWAANQNIRMISEGSCDTEDWSNDNVKNLVLHHRNKSHFTIYLNRKLLFKIFTIFYNIALFIVFFKSNKYSLGKHKNRFLIFFLQTSNLNSSI